MDKRSSMMAAATAALALGLTACGDEKPAAQTSAPTSSAAAASAGTPSDGGSSANESPAAGATTDANASAPAGSSKPTASATPATTSTGTKSTSCAATDATQAAAKNIPKIARPFPDMPDVGWQVDSSFGSHTYDPCAPLSYIVIGVQGATASSPSHIMLFHNGSYLGTATKSAPGFAPRITRVSPSEIKVTYTYPKAGEGNAGASGRTHATYRWSETQHRVVMTGAIPPTHGG